LIHAVTMVVPYRMPHPIIDAATTATRLGLVNVALVAAWLIPAITPIIATAFFGAYLYAFFAGTITRAKALLSPVIVK
jgi:hypothetical protein